MSYGNGDRLVLPKYVKRAVQHSQSDRSYNNSAAALDPKLNRLHKEWYQLVKAAPSIPRPPDPCDDLQPPPPKPSRDSDSESSDEEINEAPPGCCNSNLYGRTKNKKKNKPKPAIEMSTCRGRPLEVYDPVRILQSRGETCTPFDHKPPFDCPETVLKDSCGCSRKPSSSCRECKIFPLACNKKKNCFDPQFGRSDQNQEKLCTYLIPHINPKPSTDKYDNRHHRRALDGFEFWRWPLDEYKRTCGCRYRKNPCD